MARLGWEELPGCHRTPECNAVWCKKQEWRATTDDTGLRFIANYSLCGVRHEGRQMITKNVANLKSGLSESGRCARNGRQMLAYLFWIDSTSLLSPVSFINLSGSQKSKTWLNAQTGDYGADMEMVHRREFTQQERYGYKFSCEFSFAP